MSVSVGLAGDVMIGRLVNEFLDRAKADAIWGDLLPELHATDLNLINLEAAITRSEKIVPKVFNFKASPEKVRSLVVGRIDVVNLANNHVLDFSEEGLLETIDVLDQAKILHAGAGKNIEEAARPVVVERKGIRIGILGFTDNEPTWKATVDHPGTNYIRVGDLTILDDVSNLRKQVDIVIVTIHWGPNMQERPSQQFIEFAHQLIDHGVDIIHGHSAHIFQGYERYKKGLILYDTGDFVDDYYVDPFLRNDWSFFFVVQVSKSGFQDLRLIPTVIRNFAVHRAKGKEAEEIQRRMELLSAELRTITAVPERRPRR